MKSLQYLLAMLFWAAVAAAVHPPRKRLMPPECTSSASKPGLLLRFDALYQHRLFWLSDDEEENALRNIFFTALRSALLDGLDSSDYSPSQLELAADSLSTFSADSLAKRAIDLRFTETALRFGHDLLAGSHIASWIGSDALSVTRQERDDSLLLFGLISARSAAKLALFFNSLLPKDDGYADLRAAMVSDANQKDAVKRSKLEVSMQQYRWVKHFKFPEYIEVNIASALLRYYHSDSLCLNMKVVCGKPATRTPRFAAFCNQIVFYPYWNVPRKIVIKELLPVFQKSPVAVNQMNMQIIDGQGRPVNPLRLNWSRFGASFFPYSIRQSTGCDNALGVIKFNLTSPYDVYLHDTNAKMAFQFSSRYFSHGCIRLEKPLLLAQHLLPDQVDSNLLALCLKDQVPQIKSIPHPVPVFVIYSPAEPGRDSLTYFKDIYRLLRPR